jgi:hypothetical protein
VPLSDGCSPDAEGIATASDHLLIYLTLVVQWWYAAVGLQTMQHLEIPMRLPEVLLSATLLLPLPLAAQAIDYTYTGSDFNNIYASGGESKVFTTSDFVSVDFILSAPLADNLPSHTSITPTSFTITDGYQTFTDLTATFETFEVGTDASGDITAWIIQAGTQLGGHTYYTTTEYSTGFAQDGGEFNLYFDSQIHDSEGVISGTQPLGTWTSSPVNVPESGSPLYGLISTAALALGFVLRRRLFPSQNICSGIACATSAGR